MTRRDFVKTMSAAGTTLLAGEAARAGQNKGITLG
jgi:hypothetical protein